MSDISELRKLAKRIYDLTRRDIWIGGKSERTNWKDSPGPNWPKGLEKVEWNPGLTWTLSPEIELAGLRVRVCVSWNGSTDGGFNGTHGVRVFVDDELKYPGGFYSAQNREGILFTHKDAWSWKIAQIERLDGGKKGRVSARRELMAAADAAEKSVKTAHGGLSFGDDILCGRCGDVVGTVVGDE